MIVEIPSGHPDIKMVLVPFHSLGIVCFGEDPTLIMILQVQTSDTTTWSSYPPTDVWVRPMPPAGCLVWWWEEAINSWGNILLLNLISHHFMAKQ